MAMFKKFNPVTMDGYDFNSGRRSKSVIRHCTLGDCSGYLDRLLHCLDVTDGPLRFNDYLIVIAVHPTNVFHCKNCQIILALKLYKYIKSRSFLTEPNGGRFDPNFGSRDAMLLSRIYVVSKLCGICFYRRISASYLLEQYQSDSTFRDSLCYFIGLAAAQCQHHYKYWDPIIRGSTKCDLSPFGMVASAFARFLYMFTMHSGKIRRRTELFARSSNIQQLAEALTAISGYFVQKNQDNQDLSISQLGLMMNAFGMTMQGDRALLDFLDKSRFLMQGFSGYKWKKVGLLRTVQCQWQGCERKNKYDESKRIEKFKKCGNCRMVRYCSVRCQKLDWNRGYHKQICFCLKLSLKHD